MTRLHLNFRRGTINDVDDTSTTLTSLGFVGLPEILDGTDYLPLTIDATGLTPEIVWVTAHDSAATEVTVLRGQEGTTAVAHAAPATEWRHAITAFDFDGPGQASSHGVAAFGFASEIPSDTLEVQVPLPAYPPFIRPFTVAEGARVLLFLSELYNGDPGWVDPGDGGGVLRPAAIYEAHASGPWTPAPDQPVIGSIIYVTDTTLGSLFNDVGGDDSFTGLLFTIDGERQAQFVTNWVAITGTVSNVVNATSGVGKNIRQLTDGNVNPVLPDGSNIAIPDNNSIFIADAWGWVDEGAGYVPGPATTGITYVASFPDQTAGAWCAVVRTAPRADYPGPVRIVPAGGWEFADGAEEVVLADVGDCVIISGHQRATDGANVIQVLARGGTSDNIVHNPVIPESPAKMYLAEAFLADGEFEGWPTVANPLTFSVNYGSGGEIVNVTLPPGATDYSGGESAVFAAIMDDLEAAFTGTTNFVYHRGVAEPEGLGWLETLGVGSAYHLDLTRSAPTPYSYNVSGGSAEVTSGGIDRVGPAIRYEGKRLDELDYRVSSLLGDSPFMLAWVWNEVEGAYVRANGVTYVGPEDPADHGFFPQDGDQWKDTSS